VEIETFGAQIQGRRGRQEDAFLIETVGAGRLALVADGLGGHPGGDIASREAVTGFGRVFVERMARSQEKPAAALCEAVFAADRRLHALQRQDPALIGMATTLVALYVEGDEAASLGVGDSYLLQLRDGGLLRLNELHAAYGAITSCVGFDLAQVDLRENWAVRRGDRLLLASDGVLTLTEAEIARGLADATGAQQAVQELLTAIDRRADPRQDNVTLVAVFVPE
jgi:PPM family protein phosphatase